MTGVLYRDFYKEMYTEFRIVFSEMVTWIIQPDVCLTFNNQNITVALLV